MPTPVYQVISKSQRVMRPNGDDTHTLYFLRILPMIYLASATVAAGTTSLPRRAIPPSAPDGPERWLQLRIMENPAILLAGAASPKHARVRSMSCEVVLPGGRRIDWIGIRR